ncbi:MAG TPA: ferrous iron transport protein B [Clostridia bacterium]|nr:MAG: Ferrous iron transport protein B [Firmicutes bacterium ADurb.Bin146]HOD92327.1 ferrous iron transport protein B [Clostridia bacterium]HQM38676.1 ferrous iron transport protein B [Clostridia bacterium]
MIIALAGNQNSGKTTLFNQLTGSNQRVGNFPGVTVDVKEGIYRADKSIKIVDLPGIYSLSPYSSEEILTRDFLIKEHPDGIINIIDGTSLERGLYLSMQLLLLNIPMVIAINMMDEVYSNGIVINTDTLSEFLKVPIIPISANKNEGITDLMQAVINLVSNRCTPPKQDFCAGAVHRTLHATAHILEDHAQRANIPASFAAVKIIEGDEPIMKDLALGKNEKDMIEHGIVEMENELSLDRMAAIADMRYQYIEDLCKKAVLRPKIDKHHAKTIKVDNLLTHKIFGIPIFLGIMMLIFWLTFAVIGSYLSDLLSGAIDNLAVLTSAGLKAYGINPVVESLVIDGVFAGVGSVLSFVPTIIVLFFLLSLLEDSGYMARVAFIMDKLLRKIGLSGKSIVPMLIGFGCTVPAIMSTRTLTSDRDKKMTIFLTPFMSCSAKLPIYAVFTMAFFENYRALVMIGMYLIGIVLAIIAALISKKLVFKGNPIPFIMELPNYRLPTFKNTMLLLWEKTKDFITRAFTIIFIASIIIWFLNKFDIRFNVVQDSKDSILALIGSIIAPIFIPLGFGNWMASTALITGFMAKEAVVSTFAVLLSTGMDNMSGPLANLFTSISAFSFLLFTLLYTPCVATVAAVKRELGTKSMFVVILLQTGLAYIVALVFYQLAMLIG